MDLRVESGEAPENTLPLPPVFARVTISSLGMCQAALKFAPWYKDDRRRSVYKTFR